MNFNILPEGEVDALVAIRLLKETGHAPAMIFPANGASYVAKKLQAFSRLGPLFALTDLRDHAKDKECAGMVARRLLNVSVDHPVLVRFSVRELESWFLADAVNISCYLRLSRTVIPNFPDEIEYPKAELVKLAKRSSRKAVRLGLAPRETAPSATAGPEYKPMMAEFIRDHWDLRKAAMNSPSLQRCIRRLEEIR